jgi:hypothetical protein
MEISGSAPMAMGSTGTIPGTIPGNIFSSSTGNPYSLKDSTIFALYEEPSGNFFVSRIPMEFIIVTSLPAGFFYSAMEESGRG